MNKSKKNNKIDDSVLFHPQHQLTHPLQYQTGDLIQKKPKRSSKALKETKQASPGFKRATTVVTLNAEQFTLNDTRPDGGDKKGKKEKNPYLMEKVEVNFGDEEQMAQNPVKQTNRIKTTKYSLLTWAPLSLLFQFKRAANIYFLIISILTCLSFSPKQPASMIGTFALVLFFTMLKEAYEDFARYKQDREVNNKITLVFDYESKQWVETKWSDIKIGNLVKFQKDQESPADILVIYSSNSSGIVYVDTMNLDGETNLKEKVAMLEVLNEKKMFEIQGDIKCDAPNESLDYWEGQLNILRKGDEMMLTNIKNLLLRGCFVKNTGYGIGVVVYTGMQTKIMRNQKKSPHKVSNVMKLMNKMLYTVFAFQIVIILVFAGLCIKWRQSNATTLPYLQMDNNNINAGTYFIQLLTFWVAYSHMIPISLYVIIELLKLGQAYLVNSDVQMYDPETESFGKCRNSDLIEELGQVEMVFSDKTGTLTMNKMIFKKCQINGVKYGDGKKKAQKQDEEEEGMNQAGVKEIRKQLKLDEKIVQLEDEYPYTTEFFKLLALCNTVVCEHDKKNQKIKYSASSPDELALVQGADQGGIKLIAREHGRMYIVNQVTKEKLEYRVEAEFPFDSTRKRMSVILRDEQGNYFLYCKGADTVMYDRIVYEKNGIEDLRQIIEHDLYKYSCEGLRTLMMTRRNVTKDEFNRFKAIYNKLMTSSHPMKEAKLLDLYNAMEQKLRYLGSTAIEDKLQEGVPQTIAKIMETDIRFFMLTGDKLETAIEIAKSCKVIQEGMKTIQVTTNDKNMIYKLLNMILSKAGFEQDEKITSLAELNQQNIVIAIDGSTLALVIENEDLSNIFFNAALHSKSIVCCRVSPKQKADIVHIFKSRGKWITLAIGDGANDVSMIMEAHIGVGIKGKEGTQAVRSADYAISQFRFLLKIMLVHGRLGYMRVTQMICYYFYKNVILVFTELYFAFYNGFSGQIFFIDWLSTMYNAFFTSWQCLFSYMLEKDINEEYILKYPQVYKAGQMGKYFSYGIFWRWIIQAAYHGAMTFYFIMKGRTDTSMDGSGQTNSHWNNSTMIFTLIIHLVCLKLFVETNYWNLLSILAAIFSILFYYAIIGLGSVNSIATIFTSEISGAIQSLFTQPYFWVMILSHPITCLTADIAWKLIKSVFYPSPSNIVALQQKNDPNFNYEEYEDMMKKKQRKEKLASDRKLKKVKTQKMDNNRDSDVSLSDVLSEDEDFQEVQKKNSKKRVSDTKTFPKKQKSKDATTKSKKGTKKSKIMNDAGNRSKILNDQQSEDELMKSLRNAPNSKVKKVKKAVAAVKKIQQNIEKVEEESGHSTEPVHENLNIVTQKSPSIKSIKINHQKSHISQVNVAPKLDIPDGLESFNSGDKKNSDEENFDEKKTERKSTSFYMKEQSQHQNQMINNGDALNITDDEKEKEQLNGTTIQYYSDAQNDPPKKKKKTLDKRNVSGSKSSHMASNIMGMVDYKEEINQIKRNSTNSNAPQIVPEQIIDLEQNHNYEELNDNDDKLNQSSAVFLDQSGLMQQK